MVEYILTNGVYSFLEKKTIPRIMKHYHMISNICLYMHTVEQEKITIKDLLLRLYSIHHHLLPWFFSGEEFLCSRFYLCMTITYL